MHPLSSLKVLMTLIVFSLACNALLSIAIDPILNADVPDCRALAQSIGSHALPVCHVMLAPTHFGYDTTVTVSIQVKSIYGLDEKELLEWSAWVFLKWTDPRLAWNTSETRLREMRINRDWFWMPDIGFWNTKDSETFDLRNARFLDAVLFPQGIVNIYAYIAVQSACALDMTLFPFDNQTCTLEFGGITSDASVFNMTFVPITDFLTNESTTYFSVGEWDLKEIKMEAMVTEGNGQTFHAAKINFHLERRWMYHVVLVLVPFELLSLLASIMFLTGEKSDPVNISIAIIMSMTLYILIASQSAPKSMNTIPLVGLFLMVQMVILIVFTFVAVFEEKHLCDKLKKANRVFVFLKRHKNLLCFIAYIATSVINAVVFLCAWRDILTHSKKKII